MQNYLETIRKAGEKKYKTSLAFGLAMLLTQMASENPTWAELKLMEQEGNEIPVQLRATLSKTLMSMAKTIGGA